MNIGGIGNLFTTYPPNNPGRMRSEAVRKISGFPENRGNAAKNAAWNPVKRDSFINTLSFMEKRQRAEDYEKELEDVRINDPLKYQRMMKEQDEATAKSFDRVVANAQKYGGSTTHNGVTISVNSKYKQMSVGNITPGNYISVSLSNGWVFQFSRDSIDEVSKMLDIFSPEDITRIMESITKDNMGREMEKEIEDDKSKVSQLGTNQSMEETTASQVIQPVPEAVEVDQDPTSKEEETKVKSDIVVNADGSRQMVITVSAGDMEFITKIQLSPARDKITKLFEEKKSDVVAYGAKQDELNQTEEDSESGGTVQFGKLNQASRFQKQQMSNAYEANFMYA